MLSYPAATAVLVAAVVLLEAIALPDWKATLALLSLKLVLLPLAILSTVMRPTGLFARLLEWRALRWIGRVSYSLYLYQQLFLVWDLSRVPGLHVFQTLPASLLFALACAYASYRWIETPMIQLGHRWMRGRTAALA
jgi:peptidoglycan/LPS O-acetylase OafA/YrhL